MRRNPSLRDHLRYSGSNLTLVETPFYEDSTGSYSMEMPSKHSFMQSNAIETTMNCLPRNCLVSIGCARPQIAHLGHGRFSFRARLAVNRPWRIPVPALRTNHAGAQRRPNFRISGRYPRPGELSFICRMAKAPERSPARLSPGKSPTACGSSSPRSTRSTISLT